MRSFIIACLLAASSFVANATEVPVIASTEDQRSEWSEDQALVRFSAVLTVQLDNKDERVIVVNWERTPHNRQVVIVRDPDTLDPMVSFIQDGSVSALLSPTGEVSAPVAPWVPALFILGSPLEPEVAVNWVLGMGADMPSITKPKAQWDSANTLTQDGWKVEYLDWFPAVDDRPSMPRRLVLSREGVKVDMELAELLSFRAPPADYQEIAIR